MGVPFSGPWSEIYSSAPTPSTPTRPEGVPNRRSSGVMDAAVERL
jgi:hypothetical protein